MKKYITLIAIMMLSIGCWAQKTVVWEKPLTAYSRITDMLEVSKVEFNKQETVVTFHLQMHGVPQIGFTSNTVLQADGKDYKVKGIKDYALDAPIKMPESGELTLDMLFEPVPKDVQSLTFNMPGAFAIENIHPRNYKREGLVNTYWRNDKTGEWLIGFTKDKVIYNCRVWSITAQNDDKGDIAIIAKDGNDQLLLQVLKEKKGKRRIIVEKIVADCSLITSNYLPDYPAASNSLPLGEGRGGALIKDNAFRSGDSITIIGWYKDMPAELRDMSHEFEVGYTSFFSDDDLTFSAPIDDQGHFTLRMPVENSVMIFCDFSRSHLTFLVEPGETYFLMKDFNDGQTLIMGQNARLQNEIIANEGLMNYRSGNYQQLKEHGDAMGYLAHCNSLKDAAMGKLEKHLQEHPTLSERYRQFMRNYILADFGSDLMQGRFSVKGFRLPAEYIDNVTENYWIKMEKPYTMTSHAFSTFYRDYTDHMNDVAREKREPQVKLALLEAERNGMVTLNQDEWKLVNDWSDFYKKFDNDLRNAPDSLRMQMIQDFNNSQLVKDMSAFIARDDMNEFVNKVLVNLEYIESLKDFDKLGWDSQLSDLYIARSMYKRVDNVREPLPDAMLDYAKQNIHIPAALKAVTDINDKYLAINNRTLSSDNLKSNDDVADLSEGEQILRKLVEPYRGKLVLLDIWGTWCGPCKMRLAKSQEEYERLKDYDLVYMYLANQSPDDSWKNVIKEYNVTGPNVVHYNLPATQQKAIENHLSVRSFPSYFLFDQQGTLLEGVNADPLDLEGLERLIKRLTDK